MSIELKYKNTRKRGRYVSSFGKNVMSQLKGSYNYEKLYGKKFVNEMNSTYEKAKTAKTLEDTIECHNKLLLFLDSVPQYVKFYYPKKLLKRFKVTIDELDYDADPKDRPLTIFDSKEEKKKGSREGKGREGKVEKKDKKGNYTVYYTQYKLDGNDWTSQLTPNKTKKYAFIELEWGDRRKIVSMYNKLRKELEKNEKVEQPYWGGKTKGSVRNLSLAHNIQGKTFGNYYYKKVKDPRKTKERPEATLLKSLIKTYGLHYNYKDIKGREKKFGITVNYGNSVMRLKF